MRAVVYLNGKKIDCPVITTISQLLNERDIDPAYVECEPYAGARDRKERDRCQRVVEIPPPGYLDEPRHGDEDYKDECGDADCLTTRHRLNPTACPSGPAA